MKKTKLTAAGLVAIFALSAAPAQAGWQDTFDDIFPPIESPTIPEQPDMKRQRLSGLSDSFRNVIKDKGMRYRGGLVTPDVSTKHLILRFKKTI